jgi:acetate kinase
VRVLVPNLGSTSLKVQLLDMADETVIARGRIESIGSERARLTFSREGGEATEELAAVADHRAAVEWLLARLGEVEHGSADAIDAVGLKTVHGGPAFTDSHLVTDEVLEALRDFAAVAPAHNPIYVQAIEILRDALPGTPMVAVFETGFHRTIPEQAHLYGVPYEWSEAYGVRRYGFHGSSHRFVSQRVPELLGRQPRGLRLVSCHLGGSSSICAVRDGESVDTSFGFSPQSGVEQGTRCGDLDPFVVFHLMERMGATADEVARLLCKRSGLLGISGSTGELRELEEAAAAGDARAALAIDVYVHGIRKQIGALAAVLGGLDALAFAGGIGENSWRIRERVCAGLEFLGIELDPARNRRPGSGDAVVSTPGLPVAVLVVRTNEELVVARETVRVLGGDRTLLTRASLKEDSA